MSNFGKFSLDFGKIKYYFTLLLDFGGEVAFCSTVRYTLENT